MNDKERVRQWRTEYEKIPIPQNGIQDIKEAVCRAEKVKKKRRNVIKISCTAATAAMAMAVVMVFPRGTKCNDGFYGGRDNMAQESLTEEEWVQGSVIPETPEGKTDPLTESVLDESSIKRIGDSTLFEDETLCRNICEEICRQLEEKKENGLIDGSDAEWKVEKLLAILKEQVYDIENDILYIIILPGAVLSEEYGKQEFVIPDEMWK